VMSDYGRERLEPVEHSSHSTPQTVPPDLPHISDALQYSPLWGKFDVTVGLWLNLWKAVIREAGPPAADEQRVRASWISKGRATRSSSVPLAP
jgi:thiamine biosynthesis lipoprotein ApbE